MPTTTTKTPKAKAPSKAELQADISQLGYELDQMTVRCAETDRAYEEARLDVYDISAALSREQAARRDADAAAAEAKAAYESCAQDYATLRSAYNEKVVLLEDALHVLREFTERGNRLCDLTRTLAQQATALASAAKLRVFSSGAVIRTDFSTLYEIEESASRVLSYVNHTPPVETKALVQT